MIDALVTAQLCTFRTRLGDALRDAFDRFLARRAPADAPPIANFTRVAQPVVHLPLYMAIALEEKGRRIDAEAVQMAVEAAAMGYLYAQLQDEVVDSAAPVSAPRQTPDTGSRQPGGFSGGPDDLAHNLLLGHALYTRHQRLLLEVGGDQPWFRRLYEEKWLDYADALALERAANRGPGPVSRETYLRILHRSHPLMLPAAALLAHAGLPELCGTLEQLVRHSTLAAQLYDDLIDAEQDLADGNLTWLVRRFGGEQGVGVLRRGLYLEGGFDAVIDEAQLELKAASVLARNLGMEELAASFEGHGCRMEARREAVFKALGEALFGYSTGD